MATVTERLSSVDYTTNSEINTQYTSRSSPSALSRILGLQNYLLTQRLLWNHCGPSVSQTNSRQVDQLMQLKEVIVAADRYIQTEWSQRWAANTCPLLLLLLLMTFIGRKLRRCSKCAKSAVA